MASENRILSSELPKLGLAPLEILQKVFDQHAIISVTNVAGMITYANDKFCEVSGYRQDELMGANHRIIKSDNHPPEFFRGMWRTIAQGGTWQGQIQNRRKDGSDYWVQTTIMPVFNDQGKPEQYISIRTDVTQEVLSRRDLSKFKQLLDQTLDSVFIFDAEHLSFTYVNMGAVEQVGYTEPELLMMGPVDIKPEIDEQQFRAMLLPLLNGEVDSLTFETVHQHKSGHQVPVEFFLQYFPEHGGAGQFIAIVRDIAERKRLVDALEALTVADPARNVFHYIAKSVAEALEVRWAGVGKISENGADVELLGFWNTGHEGELFAYALKDTPSDDICRQRKPLIIPEQAVERYPDDILLRDMGAVSYRGEPLLNSGDCGIGVLFAIDDKPCEEAVTESALMRVAAKRAALELQRLQAEKMAQSQSEQMYETLERISDGFFSLDDQWRFIYVNPSAANIFNTAWYKLRGECIWNVMPDVASFFQVHLRRAMQEQNRVWIEEFYAPLNRWLALYVYPSPEGVSVYIQDVSEYKRLKLEHQRMEKQVQQAQKMDAIGQLTAGIAHDFNNILASINGYTDLALTRCVGEGQEKLQEYLEQVYKAGERARDLIQQMMAYSRNNEADMTDLDPRPLIRETVKMLHSTLPASLQLTFDSPPDDEHININMEPVQLQQMVMNLCVNARDAMHGKGRLDLRLEIIHHQCPLECTSCHETIQGDYVALSVRDSGDGMAPDVLAHLFEPFFTTKDVGEGTGLGLSVVHGIMHDHQGHILVESQAGQGAVFYLLFPRLTEDAVTEHTQVAIAHKPTESSDAPSVTTVVGKRILVVDDEPSVLGFLQAWLKRKGFEVQAYGDSHEAWNYFETHQDEVDLLITDQTMPGITGRELIQKVLTLQPRLPTVLCSGYTDQISAEQTAKLGIRHFAEKPFDHKKLLGVIEQLLSERGAEMHSGAP
ncbi:MAG: PAS domain S-box protein [Gammaproteobacteria bacterium]|nr:PAS domain S-box protein [Gammaproteobacteria bacterium]